MNTTLNPRMHISLYVSDMNATLDFYGKFFGKDPVKVKSDYAKYELEDSGLVISFLQNASKVSADFGHMGFRVESKDILEAEYNRHRSLGLQTMEEEQVNCCYALQDKYWVRDPDGYHWEVYQLIADSDWNDPRSKKAILTTCCTPTEKAEKTCCEPESTCC